MRIIDADALIFDLREYQEKSKGKHTGLKEIAFIERIIELIERRAKPLSAEEINMSIRRRSENADKIAQKRKDT